LPAKANRGNVLNVRQPKYPREGNESRWGCLAGSLMTGAAENILTIFENEERF
jgi:hypothetical protein